jgi:NAD(P)-dependent dehydrogenase (short-subunit alcohol dehydrogenase family)
MNSNQTWFVTGASKGLGLSLVKKLLEGGHKVAATSRDVGSLVKEVGNRSENFLPLEMDLVNESSVRDAIAETLQHFKKLDVVVNNAAYGLIGTLEELSDEEIRKQFDVNVFGSLNVVRQVMPYFREKKSGHVFNISSMAGFKGYIPGWGAYCAAKFAVAGMTEALAAEAKDFGVKVTLVYPGHMRTNFLAQDSITSAKNPIAEYTSVRKGEVAAKSQMNGQQQGDPDKAAEAIIKMSAEADPALHLFLGSDAYEAAKGKVELITANLERWESYGLSIDFDA